jgi:hypothetical protein
MDALTASVDASVSVTLSPEAIESALAVSVHVGAGGVTTVSVTTDSVVEAVCAKTCGGTDNATKENMAHAAKTFCAMPSTECERFILVIITYD